MKLVDTDLDDLIKIVKLFIKKKSDFSGVVSINGQEWAIQFTKEGECS